MGASSSQRGVASSFVESTRSAETVAHSCRSTDSVLPGSPSADPEAVGADFHDCTEGHHHALDGHPLEVHQHVRRSKNKGCPCCCGCCSRHWRCLTVALVVWMVSVAIGYVLIPTYIVQSRLNGAEIGVDGATLAIDSDTSNVMKPRAHVSAPQSLLYVPMLSFTAYMQPFESAILVHVDAPDEAGDENPRQVEAELGIFKVPKVLEFKSGVDVNLYVDGEFTITGPQYLGPTVNKFISAKAMPATLTAKLDVTVKAWNWFPLYFTGINVKYTTKMRGMNNFRDKTIMLDEINTAAGRPNNLAVGCSAFVYNPSPVSMHVADNVLMRVQYTYAGTNVDVGSIGVPGFKINPGMNIANGTFTLEQRSNNEAAIVQMITAYMGGTQNGFGPSGTKPFLVSVVDAGDATAKSEMVRTAMKNFAVSMNFRPQPLFFLLSVTADVVIGGPLVHWPPKLYTCTIHLLVKNPLPDDAYLEKVYLQAYHHNLSGPVLYDFMREGYAPDEYVVPGSAEKWLTFNLYISEVAIPTNFEEIWDLAQQAAHKQMTLGVKAEIHVVVNDGFRQRIDYENNGVSGLICYNMATPSNICKGKVTPPISEDEYARLPAPSPQISV